jgi:hypothetical protein
MALRFVLSTVVYEVTIAVLLPSAHKVSSLQRKYKTFINGSGWPGTAHSAALYDDVIKRDL